MEDNKQGKSTVTDEKTFTQEEVNAIIGKRLAEQKAAAEGELAKKEAELKQRELTMKAGELLSKKGYSKDIASVLKYDDEESLIKAIDVLEAEEKKKYKVVPQRLPDSNHDQPETAIRDIFINKRE